jgi:putative transposase
MPRTARASTANVGYLVLNRGYNRSPVLHKDADYEAFVDLLAEAKLRHPMGLLAYCVMFSHFHLALWPLGDGDPGRWMHRMLTAHVRPLPSPYIPLPCPSSSGRATSM